MDIPIIFEDDDVVVIDKPPGVTVHGDFSSSDGVETVASWHAARVPGARGVGEPMVKDGEVLERPGVVHRLDRETGGVLILAKNQPAFLHLKEQFQERKALKEYRAFVYGVVKEDRGSIDRPIGRSSKDFRLRSAQRGAKGLLRPAQTDWRVFARGQAHTELAVYPKTGRTHQIRVHLKAINHPIVSDPLYAPNHPPALGFARLALHAHSLTLTLPSGNERTFVSPLPPDFVSAEKMLKEG